MARGLHVFRIFFEYRKTLVYNGAVDECERQMAHFYATANSQQPLTLCPNSSRVWKAMVFFHWGIERKSTCE